MRDAEESLIFELLELASRFSGRQAESASRVYADLGISGGDFIEFVDEVEMRYEVDLDWVSPRDSEIAAQDPSIRDLAAHISRQRRHSQKS